MENENINSLNNKKAGEKFKDLSHSSDLIIKNKILNIDKNYSKNWINKYFSN